MHLCLCKLSFLSIYFYCLSLSSRSESVSIYLTSGRKTTLFLSSHFPILSPVVYPGKEREKDLASFTHLFTLTLSLSSSAWIYILSQDSSPKRSLYVSSEGEKTKWEWVRESVTDSNPKWKQERKESFGKRQKKRGKRMNLTLHYAPWLSFQTSSPERTFLPLFFEHTSRFSLSLSVVFSLSSSKSDCFMKGRFKFQSRM